MNPLSFAMRASRLLALALLLSCATLPACGAMQWLVHGEAPSESQPAPKPGIVSIGEAIAPVLPPPVGGILTLALPLLGAILSSGKKPKDKHA